MCLKYRFILIELLMAMPPVLSRRSIAKAEAVPIIRGVKGRVIRFTLIELLACRGVAQRAPARADYARSRPGKRLINFTLIELLASRAVALGRRQVRTTFTLIELLVVIAIIAVLASMLLPALKSAKDVAKKANCTGNLKQQVSAINLYTGDYDGYFITLGEPGSEDDEDCPRSYGGGEGNGITASERPLYSYIKSVNLTRKFEDNNVFFCPKDIIGNNSWWSNASYYYWFGNSYSYNNAGGFCSYKDRADNLFGAGLGGKRIATVASPSTKAMVYETDICSRNGNLIKWHAVNFTNMGFVDGHIDLMRTPYPGTSWFNGTDEFDF